MIIMMQAASVVELCPSSPDRVAAYFKEIFVSGTYKIPEQKPDKEMIVNVDRKIELVDVQTVTVTLPPVGGAAPETGNKIFAAGNIYLGVQYSSTADDQKVHFARFQQPFQTYLTDDCGDLIDPADSIFTDGYVVHVCVEKSIATQIDERTISFEVLLMVWAEAI